MIRATTLLLSLAIATAASATPARDCVSATTVGDSEQFCCREVVSSAPAASCCVLSQPAERAVTESPRYAARDHRADVGAVCPSAFFFSSDDITQRRVGQTSPPPPHPVPIYLQHLSLLL
jgi:hypothetical protein